MSKTALISPQRLRKAHRASFPVESVSWDGSQFVARCVACRLGTEVPCVKSAQSSSEALGQLPCRAYMRDEAARREWSE